MRKPGLPSLDDKLDEALKQTFPASDAFALFPEIAVEPTVPSESTRQPGKRIVRRENASLTHRRRGHDDGEEAAIDGADQATS